MPLGSYRFRADFDPSAELGAGDVPFWSGTENTCVLPACTADKVTLPGGTGMQEVSIDYTYDALNRLTSATYSNGTKFAYTYDAAGNVLTYAATHYGLTTTTTYTYDEANQLLTATDPSTEWRYTYDGNGSLIQSDPGDATANGSTRYTYNTAGYLVKLETHNGTDWQTQSEMKYDGLGNRLEMTTYTDGVGNTTRYVLDSGATLTAIGAESTTFYLYGRGVIGTLGESWSYILQDGAVSTRQLVDTEGAVQLSISYTPWGDTLEVYGSGMLNLGYMGGVYDAGTGLIYMGNGQYYDPSTGRFLTRGANADQSNPYTPWNSDPSGMLIAPLALLALVFGRKKNRTKLDHFVILVVIGLSVGLSVSACDGFTIRDYGNNTSIVVTPITRRAYGRAFPEYGIGFSEAARYARKGGFVVPSINTAADHDCGELISEGPDPMEGEYWNDRNMTKLYEIYVRMYNGEPENTTDDKWWWQEYGDDGHFSLKEFFSVLLIREFADLKNEKKYSGFDENIYPEALGRRAAIWCTDSRFFAGKNHGCDPTTIDGAGFFLYQWSSQIRKKVSDCWDSCPLEAHMENTYSEAEWPAKIVDSVMNPKPEYYSIKNDAPFNAANVVPGSALERKNDEMDEIYKHKPLYISPKVGTGLRAIFLTFCEDMYTSGYMTTYNQEQCNLELPRQGMENKEATVK